MSSGDLFAGISYEMLQGQLPEDIRQLAYDSRRVTPGDLYIALPGARTDGHQFIEQAAQRGAAAAVVERSVELEDSFPVVQVDDTRKALATLAANAHGRPADRLRLIGVTGTNGKTSIAFLLRQLLNAAGRKCGMIGTVEYDVGDRVLPASRTTPESLDLHGYFADMTRAGCTDCVMEVSSHALMQHRVGRVAFDAVGFTNLTQDHLDYHGDMESYFQAKRRLFAQAKSGAVKVANGDDPFGQRIAQEFGGFTVGESSKADRRISGLQLARDKSHFALLDETFQMPLIGRHNVANAALAVELAVGLGVSREMCARTLATAEPVPGRLEPISCGQDFGVFVDYAHTDDALQQVLKTLREITDERLHVVFGCGGNRDVGKRHKMGAAAARYADVVWVTTDNPRHESPESIAAQVVEGCRSVNAGHCQLELDRARAIDEALRGAQPGDTVLLAGKGHETYQEIQDAVLPFDDREQARSVLTAMREGGA